MYAIIESGGRQWKVEPGTHLDTNRRPGKVGSTETIERVVFAHDGAAARFGRPYVAGAQVVCEILEHRLGPKEISFYYRRRENWRKTVGHRQPLTRLLVKEILLDGKAIGKAAKAAAPKAPKADAKAESAPKAARSIVSPKTTVTPTPKKVPSKPRNVK